MNTLKDAALHSELAFRADGEANAGPRTLDLGQLAAKLNAIAAELRGEETATVELASGQSQSARIGNLEPEAGTIVGGRSDLTARRNAMRLNEDQSEFGAPRPSRTTYAGYAREAYATRRRRGNIFGNDELFGEPAWDILLDLYIAFVEDKPVSVSSACIGSAAPPTTGLRWLGVLSEQGFVLREHDPEDQRRVLVRLTDRGLSAMDEYFANAGPSA